MSLALIMFVGFVLVTLVITYVAAKSGSGASHFFAAGRSIKGWQNGIAVAGDYMSAASFLGIAGLIAFNGYDGFMYSVGWLVAYLTVLLVVAEPLRNAGKYTMADVLAFRMRPRPVRAMAALSTLTVSTFYMIAQMVGAGALVSLLLKGVSFEQAVLGVGTLMIIYVVFGGMLATTWVQIIKAILLMLGTIILSILVLAHFHFNLAEFFDAIAHVTYKVKDAVTGVETVVTQDFLSPGLKYKLPYGPLELLSLGMALILGTAGLPHILVRFYTVPDAKTARISVVWAMAIIGVFYILTTFLGFGAATIVGRDFISANGGNNMSAPLLAQQLGGDVFFAFVAAIAFATILAVVAGLTISASTSFAHDFWTNVVHHQRAHNPEEEVLVARITSFVIGFIAMAIAIALGKTANVAFLVSLAFAVAASANLPVLVLTLYWKRFNTGGACWGLGCGLLASLGLIVLGPSIMGLDGKHLINAAPVFPLENPGILSIPLGFLGAWLGTMLTDEKPDEKKYVELKVRANTGLGAEKASNH
jgi:cation/acetate symporter